MDVKKWLQSGQRKIGTILSIDHPSVVEIAGLAGFDWLWLDAEHGRFNEQSAATACAVNAGVPPSPKAAADRKAPALRCPDSRQCGFASAQSQRWRLR